MSIIVTELGPNSCSIKVQDEGTNPVNILNALVDWLLQHGWEMHDNWASNKKVIRAINADGVTYKYVLLDYSVSYAYLAVNLYESWNATTHAGTNPAGTYRISGGQDAYAFSLIVFATNRYFGFFNKNPITIGGFQLIGEHSRDNQNAQVLSYPPTYFTSSLGIVINANTSGFMFPRSSIGVAGSYHGYTYLSNVQSIFYYDRYRSGKGPAFVLPSQYKDGNINAFSTIDLYAYFDNDGDNEHRGRVYGLKIGPMNFGTLMDKVKINCDSNGFSDPNGQEVDHYILVEPTYSDRRFAMPA